MPLWKQHPPAEPVHSERPAPVPASQEPAAPAAAARVNETHADEAVLTHEVVVRGEIAGTDALYIDGEIEGVIVISNERVTIGPRGRVHAPAGHRGPCITAREIIVLGSVTGSIYAGEKVEIRANGSLSGEISTVRVSIEDGAFFRGGIDIRKADESATPAAPEPKVESGAAAPLFAGAGV